MKLTVEQILSMHSALQRLTAEKLPAAAGFRVARVLKRIAPELEAAQEQQRKLFEAHGERDGEMLKLPAAAINEHLRPLLATEIEIECPRIRLADIDGCQIAVADMLTLEPILDETEN